MNSDQGDSLPLRLLSSTAFSTGVRYVVYGPGGESRSAAYDEAKTHLPQ